jgi:hypothetical protein
MSRRLVNLTLDTLEDVPRTCRQCVFWELDPVAAERACASGDPELEKEAWVSQTLLEWGSCGKLIYVDGMPAGYVMFAPPGLRAARAGLPHVAGLARRCAAHHRPRRRTVRRVAGWAGCWSRAWPAISPSGASRRSRPFGDAKFGEPDERLGTERSKSGCLAPADFFLSVGFKTVRPHPRYPRLRLELRTALSWKSDVEYALEKLLGSMTPDALLRPVRPAPATRNS